MAEEYLVKPEPAPALNIPQSSSTVTVRVIDTTSRIGLATKIVVEPQIKGHDWITCPAYSFLISNAKHNRHILFDLGIRKDWKNLTPHLVEMIGKAPFEVTVDKGVADILDEDVGNLGIKRKDIDSVIWSHHHWDHTGDMSTFPSSTTLIVGQGLPKGRIPGYPENKDSPLLVSDYEGRKVREMDYKTESKGLKVGPFDAVDFFEDGSFYLLDTPGHTEGHQCGLARVSDNPATFIFMGGDASHHCGEFRPSEYLPLPSTIHPSPFAGMTAGCPGGMLQQIQRNNRADEAFYLPSAGFNVDEKVAERTIKGLQEFDADPNVIMIVAHDATVLDTLKLYPESMNEHVREIGGKSHWRFLKDFEKAVVK